ncbi:DUF1460 domain-containing protein, partial [Paludibacteraceae bacterium OttesenSCG-928-F17]|nr:DUF1460 domain-containing protein [Paludibacteraceae bacterium OttesenSCG-928-F17]
VMKIYSYLMCPKILPIIYILFFSFLSAFAQKPSESDVQIFNRYAELMKETPADKQFVETALFFLDSPYTANTLEGNHEEQLVVNLREFDCTTFVESCMALYNTVRNQPASYDEFTHNLELIRYRGGEINDYTSRLHYVTDWIADNENKGITQDCTKAIGGVPMNVYVNYMSAHPQSYPALRKDSRNTARMEVIENSINNRSDKYYYVPKADIGEIQNSIRTGDILFFATSIKGLDVTHAGIAYWEGAKLTFIHASSKHKKVIVNPESLSDYCTGIKSNTGVIVVRMG